MKMRLMQSTENWMCTSWINLKKNKTIGLSKPLTWTPVSEQISSKLKQDKDGWCILLYKPPNMHFARFEITPENSL